MMKINSIAALCYEANKVYSETLGEENGQWQYASEHVRASIISAINYFVAERVSIPEDIHNFWLVHKKTDGWKYGKEKDMCDKTHPNILPYKELPPEQQFKDKLFLAIVKVCAEND